MRPQVQRRVIKAAPGGAGVPVVQERFLPPAESIDVAPSEQPAQQTSHNMPPSPTQPTTQLRETAPAEHGYRIPLHQRRKQRILTIASDAEKPQKSTVAGTFSNGIRQIVQLRESFILVETSDGIQLIDQHALHEKILWLALDPTATAFEDQGVQELLIPRHIELNVAEVGACEPHLTALQDMGINAEVFGPSTLLLRSFPLMLAKTNWTGFFTELASHGSHADAIERLREAIGHRKACRAAIKAGDRLNQAEQTALVELLFQHPDLQNCPHGRPTTLDLSWHELERRFQR